MYSDFTRLFFKNYVIKRTRGGDVPENINPGSKAYQKGIQIGDYVQVINGQNTYGLTSNEAQQLIRQAADSLALTLNREAPPKNNPDQNMYRSSKTIEVNNNPAGESTIKKSTATINITTKKSNPENNIITNETTNYSYNDLNNANHYHQSSEPSTKVSTAVWSPKGEINSSSSSKLWQPVIFNAAPPATSPTSLTITVNSKKKDMDEPQPVVESPIIPVREGTFPDVLSMEERAKHKEDILRQFTLDIQSIAANKFSEPPPPTLKPKEPSPPGVLESPIIPQKSTSNVMVTQEIFIKPTDSEIKDPPSPLPSPTYPSTESILQPPAQIHQSQPPATAVIVSPIIDSGDEQVEEAQTSLEVEVGTPESASDQGSQEEKKDFESTTESLSSEMEGLWRSCSSSMQQGVWSPVLSSSSTSTSVETVISRSEDRKEGEVKKKSVVWPPESNATPLPPVLPVWSSGQGSSSFTTTTTTTTATLSSPISAKPTSPVAVTFKATPPVPPKPAKKTETISTSPVERPSSSKSEIFPWGQPSKTVTSPTTPRPPPPPPPAPSSVSLPTSPIRSLPITKFSLLNGSLGEKKDEQLRLPRSQSPTITLLQKSREGQIPKGAIYMDTKTTVEGDKIHTDTYYALPTKEVTTTTKVIHQEPVKYDGVGPTDEKGVLIALKSNITNENQRDWYKRMYKSLHQTDKPKDGNPYSPTYKFPETSSETSKEREGENPYQPTYKFSEVLKQIEWEEQNLQYRPSYLTMPRRRRDDYDGGPYYYRDVRASSLPRERTRMRSWSPPARTAYEVYRNQPQRIEDYEPGYSSLAQREARLDEEVAESRRQRGFKPRNAFSLPRDTGIESDAETYTYTHKRQYANISPQQQQEWYREVQRGGEVPFPGLQKPAPEKPKEPVIGPIPGVPPSPNTKLLKSRPRMSAAEQLGVRTLPPGTGTFRDQVSPHRYQTSDVNIHYRSPVSTLERERDEYIDPDKPIDLDEIYEEERRKRQLIEQAENDLRKHSDYFTRPSQKSPISLDRYDRVYDEYPSKSESSRDPRLSPRFFDRHKIGEIKAAARALYNFHAENPKELSFRKGEIIYLLRRLGKNWYEGEVRGKIGIFPVNYVEVITSIEKARLAQRLAAEGQARAKYNFTAQTPMEMSLKKGELVVLIRRIDENWFEGKIGSKRGIFPVSYVDVIKHPGTIADQPPRPASPRLSLSPSGHLANGSPIIPSRPRYDDYPYVEYRRSPQPRQDAIYNHERYNVYSREYTPSPPRSLLKPPSPSEISHRLETSSSRRSHGRATSPMEQLHIDTQQEPEAYKAVYPYVPQNEDELELKEGDTVYVLEKCDDGWFVGTSLRTGLFGTFPGNYVERI